MADHEPMPDDERINERLLRVVEKLVDALVDSRGGGVPAKSEPDRELDPQRQPQIKELRTYDGLRAYYVHFEEKARETLDLKADEPLYPQMLWEAGARAPRTQKRDMEGYGLTYPGDKLKTAGADWPPTTWPEQPPRAKPSTPKRIRRAVTDHSHQLGLGVAAMLLLVADVDVDGHGIVHVCLKVLHLAAQTLSRHA